MIFKVINKRLNLQTLYTLSTVLNLVKMSTASVQDTCSIKPIEAKYTLSYVTIDTEENASKLARLVVENNMAACVNIVPALRSIYKWKEKIEDDREVLLMIKSIHSKVDQLTQFIKSNHPYEVCEVITVPIIHGNPAYLKWIDDSIK